MRLGLYARTKILGQTFDKTTGGGEGNASGHFRHGIVIDVGVRAWPASGRQRRLCEIRPPGSTRALDVRNLLRRRLHPSRDASTANRPSGKTYYRDNAAIPFLSTPLPRPKFEEEESRDERTTGTMQPLPP